MGAACSGRKADASGAAYVVEEPVLVKPAAQSGPTGAEASSGAGSEPPQKITAASKVPSRSKPKKEPEPMPRRASGLVAGSLVRSRSKYGSRLLRVKKSKVKDLEKRKSSISSAQSSESIVGKANSSQVLVSAATTPACARFISHDNWRHDAVPFVSFSASFIDSSHVPATSRFVTHADWPTGRKPFVSAAE